MGVKLFGGDIELLRADEIAKKMGVHIETIRRYIREGKLKAKKIGRCYYVSRDGFKEFVDGSHKA